MPVVQHLLLVLLPDFLAGKGIRFLIVLSLSELALRLNGLGHQVHAGTQIVFLCRRILVLPENVAERHYVATGNPQHGQFRQLLVVRVGGNGASQSVESRADSVHPGSLSGIRLYSSLPCHVLVISLLTAALMMLPRRRGAHLMSLMNLMIRIVATG